MKKSSIINTKFEDALNNNKIRKAADDDEIDPEIIKWLGGESGEWFWEICKRSMEYRNNTKRPVKESDYTYTKKNKLIATAIQQFVFHQFAS